MNVADDGRAAFFKCGFAFGVAFEEAIELLARGQAINSNVNERGAGPHHLWRDETGAADGGDENVGLAGDGRQVVRLRVANGYRRIFVEQQNRYGLAHNVAAADYHRVLAGDGNVAALQN